MDNLLDTAPCGYMAFSDAEDLLYINQTLCNLLGYTKEELANKKTDQLFPIATKIFYQTHLFPLLRMQGHAAEIFIFLLGKNKVQQPLLINASRQANGNDMMNCFACIQVPNRKLFEDELLNAKKDAQLALHENSALKKAEKDLLAQAEKLYDQLQQIDRQNHQLKQLNSIATHDLQEPVRKLQVFANRLEEDPSLSGGQKKQVQKLGDLARQMQDKLAGMQEYVWMSDATIRPVDIDLRQLVSQLKLRMEEDFGNLLELNSSDLPTILADEVQVEALFYQLLKNAIQYRKPGENARVTITSMVLKKNYFAAAIGRYSYRDYLKITVKDEGQGFDNQFSQQVFDLFKKLHHSPDQKGIGLSLCKLIVENHGGTIEAGSDPMNGTHIHIYFPAPIFLKNIEG